MSDKAKQLLDALLKETGEYYPLAGLCEGYWLFNPTQRLGNEFVNLEETKSSYFNDGGWNRIETLVFNSSAYNVVPSLFTLEIDRGVKLYCSEKFKEKVNGDGLVGINFSTEP